MHFEVLELSEIEYELVVAKYCQFHDILTILLTTSTTASREVRNVHITKPDSFGQTT